MKSSTLFTNLNLICMVIVLSVGQFEDKVNSDIFIPMIFSVICVQFVFLILTFVFSKRGD